MVLNLFSDRGLKFFEIKNVQVLIKFFEKDMTVAWCTKRAELVFKCVKGFMIEMASWGGAELKNLQFLVPKVSRYYFYI